MQQPAIPSLDSGALARTEGMISTGQLPALRPSPRTRRTIVAFTILLDAMLIWLSFCIAYYLRYVLKVVPIERGTLPVPFADWVPFGIVFCAMQVISVAGTGLYQIRLGRDLIDEAVLILRGTLVGIGLVVILTTFLPVVAYSRLVSVYAWLVVIPMLLLGRGLLYSALAHLHGSGWNARRVLVAGTTPISKMVLQNLLTKRNHGYQLIGFVQESSVGAAAMPLRGDFGRFKCLGRVADLERIVRERGIDEVIVALPATHHSEIAEICEHCEAASVHVKLVPDLFEMSLSRVQMDSYRRHPADRCAAGEPQQVRAGDQARHGYRDLRPRDPDPLADHDPDRFRDQARVAGTDPVRPGASRQGWKAIRVLQVPLDAHRCRSGS